MTIELRIKKVLRNTNLSLGAKGVYTFIAFFDISITTENYYLFFKESRKDIKGYLDELALGGIIEKKLLNPETGLSDYVALNDF